MSTEKTKISFLALFDYANVLTEWSNAINKYSNVFESKMICLKQHPFKYQLEHDFNLKTIKDDNIKKKIKDWILKSKYMLSGYETVGGPDYKKLLRLLKIKVDISRISIYHAGTQYRNNYLSINKNFYNEFYKIVYAPDLYKLSPQDPDKDILFHFVYSQLENANFGKDFIKAKIERNKILITHCPTKFSTKGTNIINSIMKEIFELDPKLNERFEYKYTVPPIPNESVINLKKESLIYIDQFSSTVANIGASFIEAFQTGNILVSSINIDPIFFEQLGIKEDDIPFINIGSDRNIAKKKIKELLEKSDKELEELADRTLNFYLTYFSSENFIKLFENKYKIL